MIANIIAFLSGKKTYIIGILTVILGILQGNETLILQGITAICLRAGIASGQQS